jgi:aspartyl-tRNA(Asn)/glutamyl-tRNA(Gln) amidotransferase subunit B
MRSKEDAADYLYLPDSNLPPLTIDTLVVEKIPALPHQLCQQLVTDYSLKWNQAYQITHKEGFYQFFSVVSAGLTVAQVQLAANILVGDLSGLLRADRGLGTFNPTWLREIAQMLDTGVISGKTSKYVLEESFHKNISPRKIVADEGLGQVSDTAPILATIEAVLQAHAADAERYRKGETKLFGFFVGACTKQLPGANIALLRQQLELRLKVF